MKDRNNFGNHVGEKEIQGSTAEVSGDKQDGGEKVRETRDLYLSKKY